MRLSQVNNEKMILKRKMPAFCFAEANDEPVFEETEDGMEEVDLDYVLSNLYGSWFLQYYQENRVLVLSTAQGYELIQSLGAKRVGVSWKGETIFSPVSEREVWEFQGYIVFTGRVGDYCLFLGKPEFFSRAESLIKFRRCLVKDSIMEYSGCHSLYLRDNIGTSIVETNTERDRLLWQRILAYENPEIQVLTTGWYCLTSYDEEGRDISRWLPCCATHHGEIAQNYCLALEPKPNPFRKNERDFSLLYLGTLF